MQTKTKKITTLSAIVYGMDGKIVRDDFYFDKEDNNEDFALPTIVPDSRFDAQLRNCLGGSTSATDLSNLLSTIGCAFASPPHNTLLPRDVVVATMLEFKPTSVDLALGVKSTQADGAAQLVQIMVQVPLPSPCPVSEGAGARSNDVVLECLSNNLKQLEKVAVAKLERREQGEEEGGEDMQLSFSSSSTSASSSVPTLLVPPSSNYMYPDWWTSPSPLERTMVGECESMKMILNEDDFATNRVRLAVRDDINANSIQQAVVIAIGPSGIVLRCLLKMEEEEMTTPMVPVRFLQGATAKSPEVLRELVLDLFESVEEAATREVDSVSEPVSAEIEDVSSADGKDKVEMEVDELTTSTTANDVSSTVTAASPSAASRPKKDSSKPSSEAKLEPLKSSAMKAATKSVPAPTRPTTPLPDDVVQARRQPKSPPEEAKLAAKYAAMDDLEDRAFAILQDLGMI